MPRVTKAELVERAMWLSDTLDRNFFILTAYGQPRLMERREDGGMVDVSPRLSTGELDRWMFAFAKGVRYASDPPLPR